MAVGDAQVRFEVLGPLQVRVGDEELSLGGPKPRALLGTLLLHPAEPVGIDELTEAVWDGEPPASALDNIRTYVRTLRRALNAVSPNGDSRLETRAPGYLIRVEPGELDLADFQDLHARGQQALDRGETGDAARLLRQALDHWRGRPLADVRGGPRLAAAVVRLEERRLRVAEAWIDAQLALGAHAEVVSELRGMVAAEPFHEPLWARLMVALHGAGRTADALAAYAQARRSLVDDLGVEPGAQLQRLQREILSGDPVVHLEETPSEGPLMPPRTGVQLAESAPPAVELCPYQGLMPFDTADSEWFFGRERLVAELVMYLSSQLTPPSMLAVIGPSGSGKSSLLRAGLLPALAGGVLPATRDWPMVVFTPGTRPLVALSEAIAGIDISGTDPPEPESLADPHGRQELIRNAFGPKPGRRVVLVVDQLEELFMLCKDEREREAFVASLCSLAGADGTADVDMAPAVVVLGLRADFYGHCVAYPELIPVLSGSQVLVGPMTVDELRHAITRPAARAGLTFEPGLVDILLADIGLSSNRGSRPEPGSLPLLSHALLATWQLRDGDRLTLDGYQKAGGVHGAIATTAEAVFDRLEPSERTIVRQLFTRLVAFGEGTGDTSRRIRLRELLDGRADGDDIREVLDALALARLVVLGSDTVEIAHEALITRWPRLQQWLTDDREGLRTHRALTEAAHAWAALGHDPGALYRGARLRIARQWAAHDGHSNDMNALERAFLDASVELESSDEAAVRRRALRSRQVVVAIMILVLLAVAGGAFALWQSRRNAQHERVARSRELAATVLSLPISRRPTAMLLAVEAFRIAPTPQARGALAAVTPQEGYVDTIAPAGGALAVAFSPDGETLAEGNDDGAVTLWDPDQRTMRVRLSDEGTASTETIAFSPDGQVLASGHADGTVVVWDLAERTPAATLTVGRDPVYSLAFSPDGDVLVSGTSNGAVVLWDPTAQDRLATLTAGSASSASEGRRADDVISVAFSPDGDILASGSAGGALELWDPAARSRLATLTAPDSTEGDPVGSLSFTPDGTTLAAAQLTPTTGRPDDADAVPTHAIALWDVRQHTVAATVDTPHYETISTLAFSPDGNALAIGMTSGMALLDVSSGTEAIAPTLRYAGEPVGSLAFSPDGATLAIVEGGTAITLLNPASPQIIGLGSISQFAISPDGTQLATSGDSPRIDVWDVATKSHVTSFDSPGYIDGDVTFSPNGEWLGRTGWDVLALYHVPGEEEHQTIRAVRRADDTRVPALGGPRSVGISDNPQRVYVADSYHEVVLIYAEERSPSRTRVRGLRTAALSPNEDILATATTSGVTLWDFPDMTRRDELGALERFETEPVVAFGEDGSTLATADREVVTLWDVETRTAIASFSDDDPPIDLAVAPDNRTVALLVEDPLGKRHVTVWDAVDRVPFADLPVDAFAGGDVAFLANGTVVAAPEDDKMRFWDLDPDGATARICDMFDRGLTREEWGEFIPDQPYHATCAS